MPPPRYRINTIMFPPPVGEKLLCTYTPEELGRMVRDAFSQAVQEHIPTAPPSWTKPWEAMSASMQQVDIDMGVYIAQQLGMFVDVKGEYASNSKLTAPKIPAPAPVEIKTDEDKPSEDSRIQVPDPRLDESDEWKSC